MRWLLLPVLLIGCSEHALVSLEEAELPPPEDDPPVEEVESEPPADPSEPIADAGADQEVRPLDVVPLDGSKSYDPVGRPLSAWRWELVSAPDGSTAAVDAPDQMQTGFFADLAGDYVFALTVQNADGRWDETPDEVTVSAAPIDGFYVELSWDTGVDLDLHVLDGSTGLFGAGDCHYCNMNPSWGVAGTSDDPSLDWDSIFGFGPETITVDEPSEGTYDVRVHYYGIGGGSDCGIPCPTTTATARIYLDGVFVTELSSELHVDGDLWSVAQIRWPSGEVIEGGSLDYTDLAGCQ